MKKEYMCILFLYIFVFLCTYFITPIRDILHDVYTCKELQIPVFSGLLTVGAFLLSMKTFIIFKLKEDLYDHPEYIKTSKKSLSANTNTHDHYKGLKQLSDYLSISIFGSLIGAVLNITIGFTEKPLASTLCISISACTIILLFVAWHLVWSNLRDWLGMLENPK